MSIGIIDYGVGNLGSVANAIKKLGGTPIISSKINELQQTDALILPGDGAAKVGMENLQRLDLDLFIKSQISNNIPFLGICLGMQLLMEWSEEGNVECLGVIGGKVRKIIGDVKLPQIGWNNIRIKNKELRIMQNIKDNSYVYFIHSYICIPDDAAIITGVTNYGEEFCSVFEKENIFGVQFHPEKSGEVGLNILKNFIDLSFRAKTGAIRYLSKSRNLTHEC